MKNDFKKGVKNNVQKLHIANSDKIQLVPFWNKLKLIN